MYDYGMIFAEQLYEVRLKDFRICGSESFCKYSKSFLFWGYLVLRMYGRSAFFWADSIIKFKKLPILFVRRKAIS